MSVRFVVLFFLLTVLLAADNNSTITTSPTSDINTTATPKTISTTEENSNSNAVNTTPTVDTNLSTVPNKSNIMDAKYQEPESNRTKEEKLDHALELLDEYDTTTTTGSLNSEPEVIKKEKEDDNSSNVVSNTTKLDDVSNLDIAKAQRKQRKVEREDAKKELDTQSRVLIDTIVVKGSVLQGRIDQLTSEYISFKLIYGEGTIRIDYTDVESLATEHEYHIYFDGKETQGYITEIKDHAFLEVQHGEVQELITIAKIDRFIISENEDVSFENRMRNTFPYWSGNLDVGIEYESGANTKHKFKVAGHIERKRSIHKTIFDILYAFETTQTVDTPKVLNKHELYTFLEQDRSFSDHDLLVMEIGYDFDVPRYVDNRIYPSVGYGYRLQSTKKRWIQFKVGGGYVYENFLGYVDDNGVEIRPSSSNQYLAALFGANAEYEFKDVWLINRVLFGAQFFYMPGVKDLKEDWLLRYSVTASIPISKSLVLKMVGREVTDSNPAPEVGNNKFTFDLYLSLNF